MYQKVLVPLDGSKIAESALNHVRILAKDGALGEVILLNVFIVAVPHISDPRYGGSIDINILKKDYQERSMQYLTKAKSKLSLEGLTVKTESIEGSSAAYAIADYTQNNGVDLIIMATHGYTGIKRMLLGSVAHQVLNESPVPVLLIRPETVSR